MALDPSYVGRSFPPTASYRVGREKIREFAAAIGATEAIHRDPEAARAAGYAGASGDFNPIHWSDRVASAVGLPGVIAHGMYTMALVSRAVTAWVGGDPGAVLEYGVRFARPVVVPDDDEGAELTVTGVTR